MTELEPVPPTPATPWDAEFQRLRERFPSAKNTIIFCIHALQQDPGVPLGDLKAQADLHGLRVTAGSLNAARRLLAPPPTNGPAPRTASPAASPVPASPPTPRNRTPQPASHPPSSVEGLLEQVIAGVRAEADDKVERMRAAIREALATIRDALAEPQSPPQADVNRQKE